jgi:hypothetical protein
MRVLLRYWLLTIAAVGLLAAQRGGAHHGGGGGFSSGGFASRPQSSGYSSFHSGGTTPLSFGAQPRSYGYNVRNRGAYSYPGRYGGPGRSTGINRTLGRRYGYYGLAYYPVFAYGDNWYDPSYYPPYDEQYGPYEQYPQYGLMQDPDVGTVGNYPPPPYYPQAPYYTPPAVSDNDPPPPSAPIVVVLKTGQRVQMESYGIMNGLLWDFSRPSSRRIPLGSIDVPASVKATEEAGGSFPEQFFAANPN